MMMRSTTRIYQFLRFRFTLTNLFCFAVTAAAADLLTDAESALVAYYEFDDVADSFADSSANGNNITGNGGTDPVWGPATGFNGSGAYDFSNDRPSRGPLVSFALDGDLCVPIIVSPDHGALSAVDHRPHHRGRILFTTNRGTHHRPERI